MNQWIVAVIFLVGNLTAIMPVGLCPCWLMADVGIRHPHLAGNPAQPHPHGYLFDLFQAQEAASPPSVTTVRDWLHRVAAVSLWRLLPGDAIDKTGWLPEIEPPPPRV